jgi:hypothetical protein
VGVGLINVTFYGSRTAFSLRRDSKDRLTTSASNVRLALTDLGSGKTSGRANLSLLRTLTPQPVQQTCVSKLFAKILLTVDKSVD